MATRKAKINRAATVAAARRMKEGGPPSNVPRDSGQRAAQTAEALKPTPKEAAAHKLAIAAAKRSGGGGGGGGGGFSIGDIFDAVKSAGGKALEALDVPRAYTVSAAKELSDLITNHVPGVPGDNPFSKGLNVASKASLGEIAARDVKAITSLAHGDTQGAREAVLKPHKEDSASVEDFLSQAKRHAGYGELFLKDRGVSSGNALADVGIGLGGDVGLDPLTYIGVGALAKTPKVAGALQKAGIGADLAGEADKAGTFKRAAAQVLRDQSARNVPSDVLKDVGLPAKGFTFAGERIPGTEKLYEAATYLPNKARTVLGDARDTKAVGDLVRGSSVPLKKLERLGPEHADVALEAHNLREGTATARSLGKGLGGEYSKAYDEIVRGAKGNEGHIIPAMGGDAASQAALGDTYPKLRKLFDTAVSDAKEAGVDVGYINDYFPQQITDELRNLKPGKRKSLGGVIDSWTKQRKYVEGAELPNGVKLKGNSNDVRQQVVDYFRTEHGIDPYKTDVSEIGHTYFHGVGNKIARAKTEQRLTEQGLIPSRRTLIEEGKAAKARGQQAADLGQEVTAASKAEGAARAQAANLGVQQADAAAMERLLTDSFNTGQGVDEAIANLQRREQQGLVGMGSHSPESVARTNETLRAQRELAGLRGESKAADDAVARMEAELTGARGRLGAIEQASKEGVGPTTNLHPELSPEAQAVLDELHARGLTGGVAEARAAREASPEAIAAAQSQTPWNKIPDELRQELGKVDELPGGQTPTLRVGAQEQQQQIIKDALTRNQGAADEIATDRLAQAAGQADAAAHGLGVIPEAEARTLQDTTLQGARAEKEQAEAWLKQKYPAVEQRQAPGLAKGRSMKMDRLINLAEKQPETKAGIEARQELAKMRKSMGKPLDEVQGSVDLTRTRGGAAARRADEAAKQRGYNTVDEWVVDARQKVADIEGGNVPAEALDATTGKPNMPDLDMTQQVDREAIEKQVKVEATLGKYGLTPQDVTPRGLKLAQDEVVQRAAALDAAKVNAGDLRGRLANAESKALTAPTEEAAAARASETGHLRLAAVTDDPVQAHLHSLAADKAAAEATVVEEHKKLLNALESQRALQSEHGSRTFEQLAKDGFRQTVEDYPDLALLPEVQDAYMRMAEGFTPGNPNSWVRYYDKALNWLKGWQIATPGFVMRNVQGGIWSNFLAGVDNASHLDWMRLRFARSEESLDRAITKIATRRGLDKQVVADAWRDTNRFAHQGQSAMEFMTAGKERPLLRQKLNPVSSGNYYVHGIRDFNQFAEDFLRGSMGLDTMLKGGTPESAVELINKFHFDYEDLSSFERGLKRVVPFYTWNRHNLPLQWEQLVRQPGKFNKYTQFKIEMEQGSSPDQLMPDYFKEGGAVRLPAEQGGGHLYIVPDLPIKDVLNPPTDIGDLAGYTTPFVKTPVEYYLGKQFFKELPIDNRLKQAPAAWGFAMPALNAVGLSEKRGGDYYMTGKNAYLVEQFLPFLGRARRLAPNEPQYQQRTISTWASFLVGGGLRTNTTAEQNMQRVSNAYKEADRLNENAVSDKARIEAGRARKKAGRLYANLFKR